MRSWILGTKDGEFVSMAVRSDGSYGVPQGLTVRCIFFLLDCVNAHFVLSYVRGRIDLFISCNLQEWHIQNRKWGGVCGVGRVVCSV